MPRRSTRTQPSEVPEGERRVTRRSLQAAKEPEKPERASPRTAAKEKASKASPSPTPKGRGRGRGRGKKSKDEEEESEDKPVVATEDAQDETESKDDKSSETGAGDTVGKKPARGRGRGRGKAAAAKQEPEEEKEEEEKSEAPSEEKDVPKDESAVEEGKEESADANKSAEETKEEVTTPRKGRGRRSAGTSPAKADTPPSSGRSSRTRSPRKLPEETPTRRSGRTRKPAGKEEETTPKKEEEETEASESVGQKRKRDDDETEVADKKQKTEEAEPAVEDKKEEAMEVEEPKAEAPKEETPTAPEAPTEEATSAAEDKTGAEKPEDKPTEPHPEEPEPVKEAPSIPEEKVEPATYPPADEPEKPEETTESMDTTPAAEETEKPVEAEPVVEKEAEPDVNDYVMVNKDEIPPADSAEVAEAVPKDPEPEVADAIPKEPEPESEPVKDTTEPPASTPESDEHPPKQEVEPTSQPVSVIQEPVSSQPEASAPAQVDSSERPAENGEDDRECVTNASMDTNDDGPVQEPSKDMAAPSNNIDSVAQEPSATIPDPLFQRQYVANPNIDSTLAADATRKFSVASYNILADCHAPLSKYPWITPDHLSQEYRHKKLLQELQYLDADIFCLQEVGLQYYESTLKTTMGALGYEGSYMKRVDDNINEGEATFVRTSRFTVLSHKGIALRDLAFKELANSGLENENLDAVKQFVDRPSVVLITQLRCNNTGNTVTVGNIHVSWEQLAKPDLQCIEVADALKELVATATPQGAFFICGDFNSWPGTPVYQLTKEGYLSDQSMSELQGVNNVRMADGSLSPLINLWWKGFQHTATNMKSAYHHVVESEPHTTRYPHNGSVKQVDFVWYSGNTLETGGVLQAVQQERLADGIPNASFPSDHISLKTDLIFKL